MHSSILIPTVPLMLGEKCKVEQKMLSLCQAVAGEAQSLKLARHITAVPPTKDWIVFRADECGIAVWLPQIAVVNSRMSAAILRLRAIQRVQRAITEKEWPCCELLNVDFVEDAWTFFRFGPCKQAIWMALRGDLPAGPPIPQLVEVDSSTAPLGRFGVHATISISECVCLGDEVRLGAEILVFCRGLRCSGVITVMESGVICMEVIELNSSRVSAVEETVDRVGVQVEIGTIELGADDLFALRVGSSIELSRPEILSCTLRIGDGVFAMGELSIREREFVLRVVEILDVE